MNLAAALATVFSAGVYTKEELQTAVCTFVSEMKDGGATSEGVVRAAQSLVNEVGARFPRRAHADSACRHGYLVPRGVLSRECVRAPASSFLLVESGIRLSEQIRQHRTFGL